MLKTSITIDFSGIKIKAKPTATLKVTMEGMIVLAIALKGLDGKK
ncbi:FIG003573: hypothetical protein [Crocosphaera watsonii WH 0402]|uniref:Uncharacterized protein n=1 Tax=Crocosphaera watsonii WH 0402 TaxID=1284629 RepID=T2K0D0_CROWT|nr:FIG003573: hypothetical protein [Crocosphaera watsonii WH 0402]